ncbi:IQ domain-containing protein K-like [Montipora foliosa]|uniref:IQ domain-containing protein K-like n=1 Tax=Montipora foliosa TaxID=591990 RepID=UPI0035F16E8D
MYVAPCSPSSSIFSEMLELNATRISSKRGYSEEEQLSVGSYDASKSSPVFFGRYGHKLSESAAEVHDGDDGASTRSSVVQEFDPAVNHPATFGYVLLDRKPAPSKQDSPPLPDPKECRPREYLEAYVFPVLLPAIEQMLIAAKENKVFERRRTKFNACDFLTEYLFRNNPRFRDRSHVLLEDIPFVQEILAENPRPPLPLSLLLSDEEAAIIIQSFYRGYLVRKQPEVQELREYQREMRSEAVDIFYKVEDFWKKHPIEDEEGETQRTDLN